MEEIYEKISKFNGLKFKGSNEPSFDVTELWYQHGEGTIRESTDPVLVGNISNWLAKESRPDKNESLVLRLVWATAEFSSNLADSKVSLPEAAKPLMLEKFGLNLAFKYFSTSVNGIDKFPTVAVEPGVDQQAYSFCYAPKLAAIWSHKRFPASSDRDGVTYGIVLAEEKKRDLLKKLLREVWNENVARHAMFPAFLFSFVLSTEISAAQAETKKILHEIEVRTGYHSFKTKREEKPAAGELGLLSAKMSGRATKLAEVQRKSRALETLMGFVLEVTEGNRKQFPEQVEQDEQDGDKLLRHHVGVLQQRLKMQSLDTEYTLKRVQIQIEALVNLIAQQDSMNNHAISLSSYRDASSMKTLAFVTMFYLPGSFISALFSTDCFDWARVDLAKPSIGVTPTPQFRLYWAITIPLTVVTFILYYLWLKLQDNSWHEFQTSRRPQTLLAQIWGPKKKDDDASSRVASVEEEGEANKIAHFRRKTQAISSLKSQCLSI